MRKTKLKLVRKDTTVAHRVIYVKVTEGRKRRPGEKRAAKKNPTSEEVRKHNEHMSVRFWSIKIDANFRIGDYHIVLTYAGDPPTHEETERIIENFLKRLARRYKAAGVPFKWVLTTECLHARIHHHLILGAGVPLDVIAKAWGHGRVRNSFLYGESFGGLAAYIIKETRKTFSDPDAAFKRRCSCSRNVKTPETRSEYIAKPDFDDDPKPLPGYSVDIDTIYRGANPLTGQRYMEYKMISDTDEPRIKRWRRGRPTKPREPGAGWYKRNAPRQIRLC
jgi:hypothetical protein